MYIIYFRHYPTLQLHTQERSVNGVVNVLDVKLTIAGNVVTAWIRRSLVVQGLKGSAVNFVSV